MVDGDDGEGDEEEGEDEGDEDQSDDEEDDDEDDDEDDGGGEEEEAPRNVRYTIPARHTMNPSEMATRVASDRARHMRRTVKHHGKSAQSTKVGRRHGGGKAKHNARNIVRDSYVF